MLSGQSKPELTGKSSLLCGAVCTKGIHCIHVTSAVLPLHASILVDELAGMAKSELCMGSSLYVVLKGSPLHTLTSTVLPLPACILADELAGEAKPELCAAAEQADVDGLSVVLEGVVGAPDMPQHLDQHGLEGARLQDGHLVLQQLRQGERREKGGEKNVLARSV